VAWKEQLQQRIHLLEPLRRRLAEGQGLNITVQSYLDRLDFGLVCDPELVPDVDALLDAILADFDALTDAAASAQQDPAKPGPPQSRKPQPA
jgi:hypothetical protein